MDDVGDPPGRNGWLVTEWRTNLLLGHLHDFLAVRQIVVHPRVVAGESGDVLEREALVRRDGDMAHVRPLDALLLAADQVFQEVDRDLVYRMEKKD